MALPRPITLDRKVGGSSLRSIMATDGGENVNPAYKAFRKHSADLLKAIMDPEVLAWELYSESVITSTVVEFANNMTHERSARTSKLLMAIDSQIAVDPGIRTFNMFLSALAKRPSMSDLCGRMKDVYGCASFHTMKPQHPPTVQPSDFQHDHQTPEQQYAFCLHTGETTSL